jgi:RsiW-degrading membrane proteinase PrsW (M82 family)
MIAARSGLGAAVVENLLYAVGGRNRTGMLAINERYTP